MRRFEQAMIISCVAMCSVMAWAQEPSEKIAYPDISKVVAPTKQGVHDVAIIIAVEDYQSLPPVHGAEQSALDWKLFYEEQLGLPAERVHMLRGKDVRPDDIRDMIKKGVAQTTSEGRLWFVFIGHGAPYVDGEESDGLLVGQVARNKKYQSFVKDSIRISEVESLLEKGEQSESVLMLDACFSGKSSTGENLTRTMAVLPETLRYASSIVFTASSQDGVATFLPGSTPPRPAFSYAMLGALRGWADSNNDDEISVREAHAYVERVLLGVQSPQLDAKKAEASLPLVRAASEADPGLRKILESQMSSAPSPRPVTTARPTSPPAVAKLPTTAPDDAFVLDLVKADNYVCGLVKEGGILKCWGPNGDAYGERSTPEQLFWGDESIFAGVKEVHTSIARAETCVTYKNEERSAFCKGAIEYPHKRELRSKDIARIRARDEYGCFIDQKGVMSCYSESGDDPPVLEKLHKLKNVVDVHIGEGFLCALVRDGKVFCKGQNDRGQLGVGHFEDLSESLEEGKELEFMQVKGIRGVKQLVGQSSFTCGVTERGELKCWGALNETSSNVAKKMRGVENVQGVFVDEYPDGDSMYVVHGDGLISLVYLDQSKPARQIEGIEGAVQVYGDRFNACALTKSKHVMCWGDNEYGFLGNGSTVESSEQAVYVQGIANAREVITHFGFACALLETGQVMCWGAGGRDGMGRGSEGKEENPTPVQVMF